MCPEPTRTTEDLKDHLRPGFSRQDDEVIRFATSQSGDRPTRERSFAAMLKSMAIKILKIFFGEGGSST